MEMDWGTEKEVTKEQLMQLKQLVDECWVERQKIEIIEEETKNKKAEIRKKEGVIQEILEAVGLTTFEGTECYYTVKHEQGIRGPQSEEDWTKFKQWTQEKYPAAYNTFFKMHMGSLKAFVKKELTLAEEKGELLQIPGIPEPIPFNHVIAKKR